MVFFRSLIGLSEMLRLSRLGSFKAARALVETPGGSSVLILLELRSSILRFGRLVRYVISG